MIENIDNNEEKNTDNNEEKNIKINDEIDTAKCKVSRKSISGKIKKSVLVPAIVVGLAVGQVITYQYKLHQSLKKYKYNPNYKSYSEQIEDMMNIDLDSNLESSLNSMEVMRETIEDYQSNNALISQENCLKLLIDYKTDFENAALNIAKNWCANEWGGNAEDYRIVNEDSKHPGWVVTNISKEFGNHQLPSGSITDLVESLGILQGYSKEKLGDADKFVDTCDNVAKWSGVVATSIAESKSK